jgi:hypothetical protein
VDKAETKGDTGVEETEERGEGGHEEVEGIEINQQ